MPQEFHLGCDGPAVRPSSVGEFLSRVKMRVSFPELASAFGLSWEIGGSYNCPSGHGSSSGTCLRVYGVLPDKAITPQGGSGEASGTPGPGGADVNIAELLKRACELQRLSEGSVASAETSTGRLADFDSGPEPPAEPQASSVAPISARDLHELKARYQGNGFWAVPATARENLHA